MSNEPKYTLNIVPVGDHLEVSIPELGITVSTASGQTKLDQAVDAALAAIDEWKVKQREMSQARARAS